MGNLAIILPLTLKSKLSAKFQRSKAIDGSIDMLKNYWISKKFQLKWKIKKRSTKSKQQAYPRRFFCLAPPLHHQIKPYYVFGTKICVTRYTEIYRNIQTFTFRALQECSVWVWRNGAPQMFSLTPNRNMFAGKFVKWERFLAVFQ